MRKKVLLAFSGGIDSCRSALKLMEQGYSVTALYMDMLGNTETLERAKEKAEYLRVSFHIVSIREKFRAEIIDYFLSEYLGGRTPAPCTRCNEHIKWNTLYHHAVKYGYDHIATGHYFSLKLLNGKYFVAKAADQRKDQSYYLWRLPQHILSMALTPMAKEIKTDASYKMDESLRSPESMGVCFLKGEKCSDYLRKNLAHKTEQGHILDRQGLTIGTHDGFPFYTIGQKKGLKIESPDKNLCITAIDVQSNTLTAGHDTDLWFDTIHLTDCIYDPELIRLPDISLKIRGIGLNPQGSCKIIPTDEGLTVYSDSPVWAPANGQPSVFYLDDVVIGGGYTTGYSNRNNI